MRIAWTLILLGLTGCGGGGTTPDVAPDPAVPGRYGADTEELDDLRDDARGRDVPMTVVRPVRGGPWPVAVISHGAGGTRAAHSDLAAHLASHGFFVMLLEHVGSSASGVIALRDAQGITLGEALYAVTEDHSEYAGRLGDVSFALDLAQAWNDDDPDDAGRIDVSRVAVLGHSYGGFTTLVAGGAVIHGLAEPYSLADSRVDALVVLSPQGTNGVGAFQPSSYVPIHVPTLMLTGTEDATRDGQPPAWRREAFAYAPPGDKLLAVLEDATHLHFAEALPNNGRAQTQRIVRALSTAFLTLHLDVHAGAAAYLNEVYADDLTGSAIPDVEWLAK